METWKITILKRNYSIIFYLLMDSYPYICLFARWYIQCISFILVTFFLPSHSMSCNLILCHTDVVGHLNGSKTIPNGSKFRVLLVSLILVLLGWNTIYIYDIYWYMALECLDKLMGCAKNGHIAVPKLFAQVASSPSWNQRHLSKIYLSAGICRTSSRRWISMNAHQRNPKARGKFPSV